MDQDRTALATAAKALRAIDFEAWKESELTKVPESLRPHLRGHLERATASFLRPEANFVADVLQDLSDHKGYIRRSALAETLAAGVVATWTPQLPLSEQLAHGVSDEEQSVRLLKVVKDAVEVIRRLASPAHRVSYALAYAQARGIDVAPIRDNAERLLAETEKLHREAESTRAMVEKAAADVSRMTVEAGLVNEAKSFSAASKAFRCSAYWWTGAMVLAAGLSCAALGHFMWDGHGVPYPEKAWSVAGNLAHFAPRATLVSILLFMLVVCVRNFRAARHNQILNAHRSATVTTVQILAPPTENLVREAMLLQASQAVFSPASTGYDGKEAMVPSTLPDILRELKGGRSKDEG